MPLPSNGVSETTPVYKRDETTPVYKREDGPRVPWLNFGLTEPSGRVIRPLGEALSKLLAYKGSVGVLNFGSKPAEWRPNRQTTNLTTSTATSKSENNIAFPLNLAQRGHGSPRKFF